MKYCPTCKRTYQDEAPPFCAEDGTRLIAESQSTPTQQQGQMMSSDFSNFTNRTRSPRETSQAIREAIKRGDLDEIKRLYSLSAHKYLNKKAELNHTTVNDELLNVINNAQKIDQYGDEIIKGNKAIVNVRTGDKWEKQPFIKENGEWKLDVSYNPFRLIKVLAITIVPSFLILALVGGILFYVFALSMKHTEVYDCSVSKAKSSPIVIEQLGEPIEEGFFVWTSSYESGGSTEDAHFSTSLSGPKGAGTLYVDSYRTPVNSSLQIVMEKDGRDYDVYRGTFQCQ